MHLNPYGRDAVELAVELVNAPPLTARELAERCVAAGVALEQPAAPADLDATREFLTRWTAVVDEPDPHARAALLNTLLAAATAHPRVTDHDGSWHLHYRDDDLPLASVLRALVATGTALHLVGRGMDRLGRCALPDCDRCYADTSRGGKQRYCSPRCANLDGVRRHRARATVGARGAGQ
ncbi:CGNR zinc finger domain-containing protein [Pseudonocardia sp. GCM10023141]|uniref:CGNR zinc finger domain-containing protein n=1 Tax=Pseudonocardia sp. GCM10023141 TaxID=3252653 RepID=UPI00361879EE